MPDWKAPFHVPKMSNAEFERKRAEYVAKYGYRYSIPGFDDIIHLPFENPMTPEEKRWWKKKEYSKFSPQRYEQIKYMKEQRRRRYLDMLGSPQPQIFRTRGSIIGAIDDAQDAISTAALVGSILAKYLPRQLAKVLTGPLGWVMTAGDLLDLMMKHLTPEQRLRARKRIQDELTDENPFSKEMRIKRAAKIRNAGFHWGDILEAGQVTKDVFGIGVSLGGLMNLPLDILSGAARRAAGQKVNVKWPIPSMPIWIQRIMKGAKALCLGQGLGWNPRFVPYSMELIASNICAQAMKPYIQSWNPLDQVERAATVQVEAPKPSHPLTMEVIQEIDPGGLQAIGWPQTGKRWETLDAISRTTEPVLRNNFATFCQSHKRNWTGFVAATNASQACFFTFAALEGEKAISYSYTPTCKTCHGLLDQNMYFPQDLSVKQQEQVKSYMAAHEAAKATPSTPSLVSYAKYAVGFEFKKGPYVLKVKAPKAKKAPVKREVGPATQQPSTIPTTSTTMTSQ